MVVFHKWAFPWNKPAIGGTPFIETTFFVSLFFPMIFSMFGDFPATSARAQEFDDFRGCRVFPSWTTSVKAQLEIGDSPTKG
jgi:hypothetical protein